MLWNLSMNSAANDLTDIPSIDECLQYMQDFNMYENIRRHSFMVARVADILHRGLVAKRPDTPHCDRKQVIAGALLHDIAKTKCLQEGCSHARVGKDICLEQGLLHIAPVVANHVILADFNEAAYQRGQFSAIELVFYADKRVKHDQVVSLDKRLLYIIDKYSNNEAVKEERIRQNFDQCRRVEKHLFNYLDFSPEEVALKLVDSPAELLHYLPE